MTIVIDTADKGELKAYARDELGLSLSMNMGEDTMRQKIRDKLGELGMPEPTIEVDKVKTDQKQGWVTINISKSSEKGGGQPVFVAHNGKGYSIPRGIDIPVPPAVEHILGNAIKTVYEEPEESGQPMIERDVLSYPYQVVSGFENIIPRKRNAA